LLREQLFFFTLAIPDGTNRDIFAFVRQAIVS